MTHHASSRQFVLLAAGLVLMLSAAIGAKSAIDQTELQYVASTDPHRAVLFLAIMSPQTAVNRSMTLYGGGRLVLAELGTQRQVIREKELRLSAEEGRELLDLAVGHRLAEYDETDIRARQLRGKTTPGAEGALDAPTTIFRIALDSYSGDGRTVEGLDKEIQVYGVKGAARSFPDILEFQGLKALQERLFRYWTAAGWPLW